MLTGTKGIEDLAEALEVRFLANQDVNLHFALLTDFVDADKETMPEDTERVAFAQARIRALNEKYGAERATGAQARHGDVFYLLHRPRVWNSRERLWMGYERKRGKLGDLNAVLRGDPDAVARFHASSATRPRWRASSTSSRSTRIPSSRATPPGNSWAPWRIR
jgi:hypothetical protein